MNQTLNGNLGATGDARVGIFAFFLAGILSQSGAFAQTALDHWQDENERTVQALRQTPDSRRTVVPGKYRTLRLNQAALGAALATAPREFAAVALPPAEITLPMPDGTFPRFTVEESSIMEPALAAKFPDIKTYVCRGIDNPEMTGRLDQTPQGFHAIIFTGSGSVYIDPYWRDDTTRYLSYRRRDFSDPSKSLNCQIPEAEEDRGPAAQRSTTAAKPTGAMLRTYRLAVACTGEYTTAAGGGTVLGALGAIITTVNRVSAVYERDFAIRMVLVANEEQIIFTDAVTDGFTNNSASSLINESQTKIDAVIGNANYDIGHTFSTGGGGLAGLGVVGRTGQKARGITGSSNPVGDPYDIDYVAHEMGHQFGGSHTFNGTSGPAAIAVPRMPTNPEAARPSWPTQASWHRKTWHRIATTISTPLNYDQIDTYTTGASAGNVGVPTATGNTPPTIGALTSFTIPNQTPFSLTASATDPDSGDVLTYCWEEFDKGAAQDPTADPRDNGASPLFRSFDPTTNPVRVFPSLTYILNNANVPPATLGSTISGEFLPTTNRTMTFRVTVRDNRPGGGGSNYASTTVTSTTSSGPFALTSFNSSSSIAGGSSQAITWSVASTTAAPVSCANVKISLSTDGGYTYPFVLAASTPNDGSQTVTIPNVANVATTQGRFKVEAVGNIFFDVSNANTTITSSNTAPVLTITGSITVRRATPTPTTATVATVSDGNTPLSVAISNAPADTEISASLSGNNVVVSARADASIVTTNSSRTYPITLTVADSLGSTTSGTFNLIVQPNLRPTLGTYTNQNVNAGNSATATPTAGPADSNGNLGPTPLTVTPTTLSGGGTLTVNQTTGVVSITTLGTTLSGTIPVRVTVRDTAGAASVRGFDLVITSLVPAITSAATAGGTIGNAFAYQITASNSPTSYGATGLPAGLSLNPGTGLISGTPTTTGVSNVTISATNGAGAGTAPLVITVTSPVFLAFPLDTNPGWTTQGEWAFGTPTGAGGAGGGNVDPTAGATGTKVFGVNLNGDYSTAVSGPHFLTAGPFDFSGRTNTTLRFQRWLNTDFQPWVSATIEASTNGTTWTPVWDNGISPISDAVWTPAQYDISSVADNQSAVYVRWGYQVAAQAFAYSGWNIDDVEFSGVSSYNAWTGGSFTGSLSDPSAALDFDGGGLDTGIEWVVGGDPTDGSDDAGKAPTVSEDGAYLVFTYNRNDAANDDPNTTIVVEYGGNLTGWTTAVNAIAGVIITETPGSPADVVEVKIPMSLAAGSKLFARLNVVVAP